MRPIHPDRQTGFTLVEILMVLTLVGMLSGIVMLFLHGTVSSAVEVAGRMILADTADTALRRMRRDVARALPNSVRITSSGSTQLIEFIPTVSGGVYCAEGGTTVGGAACTALDFTASSASFGYIGTLPAYSAADVAEVAIYNLGISGADAYNSDNTTAFTSVVGTTVNMTSKLFPFASPGNRFHLIGRPVSYVCAPATSGTEGTGTLTRVSGYAKQAAQPTNPAALASASSRLLASNVSACTLDYVAATIDQNGLLSLTLRLLLNNETVNLTHVMQINNVP